MKSQTASEVMELKVSRGAGQRVKRTAAELHWVAQEGNIGPDVFVPKIDIEISKVQDPVLADAKIDSTATRPTAANSPAAIAERVGQYDTNRRVKHTRIDLT